MKIDDSAMNASKFITAKQFAEKLDGLVSLSAVYYGIKHGQIPVIVFNRKKLIPAQWAQEFLNSAHYIGGEDEILR